MSDLRNKLIRLAHQNPALRADLLPLLKQAKKVSSEREASSKTSPLKEAAGDVSYAGLVGVARHKYMEALSYALEDILTQLPGWESKSSKPKLLRNIGIFNNTEAKITLSAEEDGVNVLWRWDGKAGNFLDKWRGLTSAKVQAAMILRDIREASH